MRQRTVPGRRVRTACVVVIVALIAIGSLWGSDDGWPFAPFRMYATESRRDGRVLKADFVGQTHSGYRFRLKPGWLGLRPAEVEGQLPLRRPRRLPPGTLGDLARAWNSTHNRQIVRFELHLSGYQLRGGQPKTPIDEVVEVWDPSRR